MDLAARHLGGGVVAASDESFGAKELLLRAGPVAFVPGTYDHKGEVVDGWETRRRRGPGADWAVVRLGLPGIVRSVDVDTTSFSGNAPATCRIEACAMPGHPAPDELTDWQVLVPDTALLPDTHNVLPVEDSRRWTHLRLWAAPDGGVGRLRVEGDPLLDPRLLDGLTADLASQELGAEVVACSDDFYSPADALLLPDRPRNMGEGWEARRRRGPGHDVVVVRLGLAGTPRLVEIDTTYFVHNASGSCALWAASCADDPGFDDPRWTPLLSSTRLQPDTRHRFRVKAGVTTHVRLDAHPDGGLARLRVVGPVDRTARGWAAVRWLDALPEAQALAEAVPASVVAGRPFRTPDALRQAHPDLATTLLDA
ncbi:MAG: putative allantoicase [Frankiales bacterium]|nr:putative allantoicase [Frankiales bacterium]